MTKLKKINRLEYRKQLIAKVVPVEEPQTASKQYDLKEQLTKVKVEHYSKVKQRYIAEVIDRMRGVSIRVIETHVNYENIENFWHDHLSVEYKTIRFEIYFSTSGISMYVGEPEERDVNGMSSTPYNSRASRSMRTLIIHLDKLVKEMQERLERERRERQTRVQRRNDRRLVRQNRRNPQMDSQPDNSSVRYNLDETARDPMDEDADWIRHMDEYDPDDPQRHSSIGRRRRRVV